MKECVIINVNGIVQGVGFRPTVCRYANEYGLAGTVSNGPGGVCIEVEGPREDIDSFVARLREQPPPQAQIESMDAAPATPRGSREFRIVASSGEGERQSSSTPPDLAMCRDCRAELTDPADRRFQYPFLNCTNCGPRYTIIQSLPYDRQRTSMHCFHMCEQCRNEYDDPLDRRFDAQPNACPSCGPRLQLVDSEGNGIVCEDPLEETVRYLRTNAVALIKGLGGYHLACSAISDDAVGALRRRKKRPAKALAVMFRDMEQLCRYCRVTEPEEAELLSYAAPIVILRSRRDSGLSSGIAPDTGDVGAFLAYTPLHYLLLERTGPLVMTSANFSEEPIATNRSDAELLLDTIADVMLDHERPIARRVDDSVLRLCGGQRVFVRRSRAYMPDPVELAAEGPV